MWKFITSDEIRGSPWFIWANVFTSQVLYWQEKSEQQFHFYFLFFALVHIAMKKNKHFRSCPLQSAGTWKAHLPSHYDEKTSHISQTFNTSKMRRCLIPHKLSRLCRIYRPIDRSLSRRSRFKRGLQKSLTNKNYVELQYLYHLYCIFPALFVPVRVTLCGVPFNPSRGTRDYNSFLSKWAISQLILKLTNFLLPRSFLIITSALQLKWRPAGLC